MSRPLRRYLIGIAGCGILLATLYGAASLYVDRTWYPGAPRAEFPEPANRLEARQQDLAYFRHYLNLDKSYTSDSRAAAEFLLAQLEPELDSVSDAGFQLGIARAVAAADNGHYNIWMGRFSRAHGRIPLRLYWFSDGLYVVRAHPDHAELLGSQLLSLNGVEVDVASRQLREFVGGTDEAFRAYRGPALFEIPAAHPPAGLGITERQSQFSFRRQDGNVVSRTLAARELDEDAPLYWPNRYLYAQLPEGGKDDWLALASGLDPVPRYLQNPERAFQLQELPQQGLYIQFRQNYGDDIEAFQQSVRLRLEQQQPRYLVVDQRFNGGGDYTLTEELMMDLPGLAGGAPIYVITGPATFSAGINSVAFVRAAGGKQVTIVGERIGDRERMYGETNDFELPNSKLGMTFNTGLHDVANGCPPWPQCYWRNYLNDVAVGPLDPDIEVASRFRDYAGGADPVLEHILARHR